MAAEMRNYGIELLGLSETRWLQAGEVRLHTGEIILYSGHEEEGAEHTLGVGFMLGKKCPEGVVRLGSPWPKNHQSKL